MWLINTSSFSSSTWKLDCLFLSGKKWLSWWQKLWSYLFQIYVFVRCVFVLEKELKHLAIVETMRKNTKCFWKPLSVETKIESHCAGKQNLLLVVDVSGVKDWRWMPAFQNVISWIIIINISNIFSTTFRFFIQWRILKKKLLIIFLNKLNSNQFTIFIWDDSIIMIA